MSPCTSGVARGGPRGPCPPNFWWMFFSPINLRGKCFLSVYAITRWCYFHSSVMITRWRYCINAVMITRWQDCLSAAMITRWHHCIGVEMVTGQVHWIVNVFNCKKTLDCKKKTPTSPNSRERPLIWKTGWGTTEREREKETERGRDDAVFYEKRG